MHYKIPPSYSQLRKELSSPSAFFSCYVHDLNCESNVIVDVAQNDTAQDSDAPTMPLDIDETTMSRSASVVQPDDIVAPSSNKRPRRDKGKGKERPMLQTKVS